MANNSNNSNSEGDSVYKRLERPDRKSSASPVPSKARPPPPSRPPPPVPVDILETIRQETAAAAATARPMSPGLTVETIRQETARAKSPSPMLETLKQPVASVTGGVELEKMIQSTGAETVSATRTVSPAFDNMRQPTEEATAATTTALSTRGKATKFSSSVLASAVIPVMVVAEVIKMPEANSSNQKCLMRFKPKKGNDESVSSQTRQNDVVKTGKASQTDLKVIKVPNNTATKKQVTEDVKNNRTNGQEIGQVEKPKSPSKKKKVLSKFSKKTQVKTTANEKTSSLDISSVPLATSVPSNKTKPNSSEESAAAAIEEPSRKTAAAKSSATTTVITASKSTTATSATAVSTAKTATTDSSAATGTTVTALSSTTTATMVSGTSTARTDSTVTVTIADTTDSTATTATTASAAVSSATTTPETRDLGANASIAISIATSTFTTAASSSSASKTSSSETTKTNSSPTTKSTKTSTISTPSATAPSETASAATISTTLAAATSISTSSTETTTTESRSTVSAISKKSAVTKVSISKVSKTKRKVRFALNNEQANHYVTPPPTFPTASPTSSPEPCQNGPSSVGALARKSSEVLNLMLDVMSFTSGNETEFNNEDQFELINSCEEDASALVPEAASTGDAEQTTTAFEKASGLTETAAVTATFDQCAKEKAEMVADSEESTATATAEEGEFAVTPAAATTTEERTSHDSTKINFPSSAAAEETFPTSGLSEAEASSDEIDGISNVNIFVVASRIDDNDPPDPDELAKLRKSREKRTTTLAKKWRRQRERGRRKKRSAKQFPTE